ncbi:MAG: sulfotransferase [Limnoraphis robusta]|uniref:Sulfotransferase n=1 Tax=Limnoraphis robusta CCNP1315 TaxID=3110306 RepID=A0ABU5TVA3_9CYAN|nr:sulfotransferase [Limnoraphis robusta]MEA5518586.1 sulfotransferase [Limnoraphis robusta CCNP1315]MEA5548019.1 sulfotransferase [Limnoraphis robusta CCNP1324]
MNTYTVSLSSPIHFISGLPRAGSTVLAAILRQNPRFHAGMTSPVGGLVNRMLDAMSEENEFSVFLSQDQRRDLILSIFSAYYQQQLAEKKVVFDTNRLWCSKLPLICQLFPEAKVICCVRNVAWVMDSLERLVRRNAFEISRMFRNRAEISTVYSRTEALSQGNRLVGFAYNALKEAFYSEQAERLLLVDYEFLAISPEETLSLIYQFLGEEPFDHDLESIEYEEPEFDRRLRTEGLHTVRSRVEFKARRSILPPDLFERFSQLSFWKDTTHSAAKVIHFKTSK